jgi:beta-glucosidase
MDTSLPHLERARDLVSRLTIDEKAAQLCSSAPAIPRLGLAAIRWGSECIHGLGRTGRATVFPQAIALAATFDVDLMTRVATAISDEVRAKHAVMTAAGNAAKAPGLVCWSPNINIFRDGRWGRGQETYGEDPYLTARMAVAFIKAVQAERDGYLKMGAAVKHFAVHSGPDAIRHSFDIHVSEKDLWETYLPAFAACIREAGAVAIMGAYNRLNGEHCCASPRLLGEILRGMWGFAGFVLSDGGALDDLHKGHAMTATPAESAALAMRNGCDMCLGRTYDSLPQAVAAGLVTQQRLDAALVRLTTARLRLGLMDPPQRVPWTKLPPETIESPEHRALARTAAAESMVLLRNARGLLPLARDLRNIAVVGPLAATVAPLLGNYFGVSGCMVTPLEGITAAVSAGTNITYWRGCDITGDNTSGIDWTAHQCRGADAIVACLGLTGEEEGESWDAPFSDFVGDRNDLRLPPVQQKLLEALVATGRPVVLVLSSGGPMAIEWAMRNVPVIIHNWYSGEEGGSALADVLFGDVNPSGRLPITWPRSVHDLPAFTDYSMVGRTYRYATREPLLPFGYGLSYTTFAYSELHLSAGSLAGGESLAVRCTVANTGSRAGKEVVQVYLSDLEASCRVPVRQLVGFQKVELSRGESRAVSFTISPRQMAIIDEQGKCVLEPGRFRLTVGGSQGDDLSQRLMGRAVLSAEFEVTGQPMPMAY